MLGTITFESLSILDTQPKYFYNNDSCASIDIIYETRALLEQIK